MTRINITEMTDDYGNPRRRVVGWFNPESAEKFTEKRHAFDDANLAGVHLRDQNRGQVLYHTAGGRWVLMQWSRWQGESDVWTFVSDEQAREWLIANEEDDETIERLFGERVEPERGPGRPEIGPPTPIRLPEEMIGRLDEIASQRGTSRAAVIRDIIGEYLAAN